MLGIAAKLAAHDEYAPQQDDDWDAQGEEDGEWQQNV